MSQEPTDVPRLRQAFASLASNGRSEPVDAEYIFDALHGDLSPEQRHAMVEEILVNPAAAQAWRLARDLPVEALPERSTSPAMWTRMSMAAAAVLLLGLGWQFIPGRHAEDPVYRSVETRAIASALAPGGGLSRAEPVLRWSGVEGARYRARVLTTELELLEESGESPAREFTLSEETLRRIAPGGQLLWQVEGRVPGEAVIASSTFRIRVP